MTPGPIWLLPWPSTLPRGAAGSWQRRRRCVSITRRQSTLRSPRRCGTQRGPCPHAWLSLRLASLCPAPPQPAFSRSPLSIFSGGSCPQVNCDIPGEAPFMHTSVGLQACIFSNALEKTRLWLMYVILYALHASPTQVGLLKSANKTLQIHPRTQNWLQGRTQAGKLGV